MNKYIVLTSLLMLTSCADPKCKADQVMIGMSEQDLVEMCGTTNRNYYLNGPTQWVYKGYNNLYVYTKNGKVLSKQWSN